MDTQRRDPTPPFRCYLVYSEIVMTLLVTGITLREIEAGIPNRPRVPPRRDEQSETRVSVAASREAVVYDKDEPLDKYNVVPLNSRFSSRERSKQSINIAIKSEVHDISQSEERYSALVRSHT